LAWVDYPVILDNNFGMVFWEITSNFIWFLQLFTSVFVIEYIFWVDRFIFFFLEFFKYPCIFITNHRFDNMLLEAKSIE
jgi:hypothetical protein